ncbi:hypothetical protein DFJ74DRAFT_708301 [Hyaloraphidium curvatum]|nr:hypothetical protein DFJ74DRAFT_708301 [Hyaloraphidium curvatum]
MAALDYSDALILAPMVRCGTLPMRLMALRHGADIVYGPEEVDRKVEKWARVENRLLGTVDFLQPGSDLVQFRTHPSERSRFVFQLGSADPDSALRAARVVEKDVAGIDLNCGCPKSFSTSGGMGAGLLSTPDKLCAILENLVRNLSVPVTCKIRLLDRHGDTVELVRRIAATGVRAIALHARTKGEEYKTKAHWDMFRPIKEALNIPLIVNGDLWDIGDLRKVKELSGASSFMFARAPEANPSIFRHLRSSLRGPAPLDALPLLDALREYVLLALEHDMPYQNAKYVALQMYRAPQKTPQGRALLAAKSQRDIAEAVGVGPELDGILARRAERAVELRRGDGAVDAAEPEAPSASASDSRYDDLLPLGYKAPRQRAIPEGKAGVLRTDPQGTEGDAGFVPQKRERTAAEEEEAKRRRAEEEDPDSSWLGAAVPA